MSVRNTQQRLLPTTPTNSTRLDAVLTAGLVTGMHHTKRTRTDETEEPPSSNYKWLGVEYVPYSITRNRFDSDIEVPILSIPEFYVVAHVASNGDDYRSIFKSIDREAGVGKYHDYNYSPRSPGMQLEVWTNAKPLGPPVNIQGASNNVLVAHLYTANLPLPRPSFPLGGREAATPHLLRLEEDAQRENIAMQRFYVEYLVFPGVGEKFVLVELYRNGKFVALGATKFKVNPAQDSSAGTTDVDTDALVAAERLLGACPWL